MPAVDWNAVSAIGQWVGAIATFVAVVVALRAEFRSNAIRLNITTVPAVPPTEVTTGKDLRVIVVNRSNRPVPILSGGVLLPDGTVSSNQVRFGFREENAVKEWDRLEGQVSAEWLSHELIQKGCRGIVRLKVFVEDATGKRHWIKTRFNLAPYIAKREARQRAELEELAAMIEGVKTSAQLHVEESPAPDSNTNTGQSSSA